MLAAEPSTDVQLFVVWVNPSPADSADVIDTTLLDDPRVKQYWDGGRSTGTFFADRDLGRIGASGFVYDVYYVFGPDARWGDEPGPVTGAGVPVVSYVDELLAELRAQL